MSDGEIVVVGDMRLSEQEVVDLVESLTSRQRERDEEIIALKNELADVRDKLKAIVSAMTASLRGSK